jgi:hypothetical protein
MVMFGDPARVPSLGPVNIRLALGQCMLVQIDLICQKEGLFEYQWHNVLHPLAMLDVVKPLPVYLKINGTTVEKRRL